METILSAGWRRAAGAWLRMLEALRPHRLPLAVVLLACGVSQLAVLTQRPLAWISNDSPDYIYLAHRMLTAHQFIDAYRTPAYPVLLALILLLSGSGGQRFDIVQSSSGDPRFDSVVLVQGMLIILAAVEIYALTYRICRQRWTAAAVGALTGLNVFVATWERVIMTETLAYWLVVTLFLVFERYLRGERARYLIWFGLISVAAILTRPIFVLLPALLLLIVALWAARTHTLRRRWKQLSLTFMVIYGLTLGYMGANGLTTGYFGLSDATNILLFGKVLRFDMYNLPLSGTGSQNAQLQAEITQYVAQGGKLNREPWGFLGQHPIYRDNHLAVLGAFSRAEIEQHPLYFAEQTLSDVLEGFYAGPDLYAPTSYAPLWITILYAGFRFFARAYVFFPLLLVAAAVRTWRRPVHVEYVVSFAAVVAYMEITLLATTTSYEGFWRLRFPIEWGTTLVGTVTLVAFVRLLARSLFRWRSHSGELLAARSAGNR